MPFTTYVIAGLPATFTPTGYLAKSMRRPGVGRLPTPAELYAQSISTLSPEDSERLFRNIMKMIGPARDEMGAKSVLA